MAVAERLLAAIRDGDSEGARRLFEQDPEMARGDLAVACCVGDATAAAEMIGREPQLATTPDPRSGWPPLLHASASMFHAGDAERGHGIVRCAELLLDAGADPNSYMLFNPGDPESKIPALYFACVRDHVALVRLLLERGAEPNDGESVYHSAELDHRDCLELLRAHGANLEGRHARWNNTPLYFLAGYREGHPGAPAAVAGVRWLLEHGANPNVTSYEREETPLHQIARHGGSLAMAELLLEHGADPDAPRADGHTPYMLALRAANQALAELLHRAGATDEAASDVDRLLGACMRADAGEARAILERDPDLLSRLSGEERSFLAQAASEGRINAVRLMAELGFDLAAEGEGPGTPLHHAAWFGNPEMARTLIALGAPVNVRDREFGSSPLGWAAHGSRHCRDADSDYLQVIQALLEAGADRGTSINRWNNPPESLASPAVAAVLAR